MLYVSRHFGMHFYGVVDTDDDTEEIVTRSRLVQCVEEDGLTIRGADLIAGGKRVGETRPCQVLSEMTQLQIKTDLMKFTEVKTFKTYITSIHWRHKEINTPVTIRLSDFGSKCADCILWENDVCKRHVITLVLDDKVEYSDQVFRRDESINILGPHGLGVVFDMRDVHNPETAEWLYKHLHHQDGFRCLDYIIDSDSRKKYMRSVFGLVD